MPRAPPLVARARGRGRGRARAHNMARAIKTESDLRAWEARKGFAGVIRCNNIRRKCDCGQPTKGITLAQCHACATGSMFKRKHEYKRCVTPACGKIAHRKGKWCRACWIRPAPSKRACPSCHKSIRAAGRSDGRCTNCVRSVERAAARLWRVSRGDVALACNVLRQLSRAATGALEELLEEVELAREE